MKICFLPAFLSASSGTFAFQTASIGTTFSCEFLDTGETRLGQTSTDTWTTQQIDAAIRALSTWDNLIANTPGRTLTVGLSWYSDSTTKTLANASSPVSYYLQNPFQQVSTFAEDIWKNGNGTAGNSDSYDIIIHCNAHYLSQLYFNADIPSSATYQYDFQSILTHEIGHAVGFMSLATETGSFRTISGTHSQVGDYSTTLYTAYDKLMTNEEGQQLVSLASKKPGTGVFSLGDNITLGETGLAVYNPAEWKQGSSMGHIDPTSDSNALMQPFLPTDTYRRTLTEGEMQVMTAMGWNMIPEPSTVTLSLLALGTWISRRRRSAA